MVPVFYLYMYAVWLDVLKDGYVNPVKVTMQHMHLLFDFVGVWMLVTLHCYYERGESGVLCCMVARSSSLNHLHLSCALIAVLPW